MYRSIHRHVMKYIKKRVKSITYELKDLDEGSESYKIKDSVLVSLKIYKKQFRIIRRQINRKLKDKAEKLVILDNKITKLTKIADDIQAKVRHNKNLAKIRTVQIYVRG